MRIKITVEVEIDESYGTSEEERVWMENEILVADGSLMLHSNEIGDEVGIIKKVTNIQWIEA